MKSHISIALFFNCIIIYTFITLVICEQEAKLQIGVKKRIQNCDLTAKKGDLLHVHYRGMLENEEEFDNSYLRNKAFTFTLGMGQVIKGWEQGVLGMCIGEIRKLVIPPHLGYGSSGSPPTIPPDSKLIFHIELLNIEERDEL